MSRAGCKLIARSWQCRSSAINSPSEKGSCQEDWLASLVYRCTWLIFKLASVIRVDVRVSMLGSRP